jgi:subtilisin family serine protease
MKKLIVFLALIILINCLWAGFVEGNVLFKCDGLMTITGYNSGVVVTDKTWFNDIADEYLISEVDTLFSVPTGDYAGYYYISVYDTSYSIEDVIDDLEKEQDVEYAEPNHEMEFLGIDTNDDYHATSWGLDKIGMNQVWADHLAYGDNVMVAVLDTGIDLGISPYGIHPDLMDNLWDDGNGVHGYNVLGIGSLIEEVDVPQDLIGHGTHVSGIIGAATNNGIGVAGVAGGWGNNDPGCTLLPIKLSNGRPTVSSVLLGINWANAHSAEVYNLSFGVTDDVNQTLRNRILSIMAFNPEVVFVAAAGNDGQNVIAFPASIDGVVSVGATGPDDAKASYSNYGWLDICAPGGIGHAGESTGIISTTPQDDGFSNHNPLYLEYPWNREYEYVSGTSMACPMVVGAVALLKEYYPGITRDQIIQRLQGTADDLTRVNTNPTFMTSLGTGRLNVYRALTEEAHPSYRLSEVAIDDGIDNILTIGETEVDLLITLKNWWIEGFDDVVGILTSEDPCISINSEEGIWECSDYLDTTVSSGFVISDSSPYPRYIRFQLNLYYEDVVDTVFFELPCYPNLDTIYNSEMYRVTSEMTIFDLDNDGIDEIAFGLKRWLSGGFDYYACLYNNAQVSMYAVNDSISTKPAFADLVYGGNKEVVFVTNEVTVYAFDSSMSLLSNFPHTFNVSGHVKSLVIDDITGNGQMDIVANGNRHYDGDGFVVLRLQHEYPGVAYEDQLYLLDTGYQFLSELAVGNVDDPLDRELVALILDDDWVGMIKLKAQPLSAEYFSVDGIVDWILDPGNEDINRIESTNVLLIKPQFKKSETSVFYNWVFFGISLKYNPGIETRVASYCTYCYDFSDSTDAEQVWCHIDNSCDPPNQSAPLEIDPGKLIAGNFYASNDGIELLTTASEEVIDIENGHIIRHLTNDYSPINGGYYYDDRRPTLLMDLDVNNSQDLVITEGNHLSAYLAFEQPLNSYNLSFCDSIQSVVTGAAVSSSVIDIYILVGDPNQDGVRIYYIPVKDITIDDADEWTQLQNNERNTGQYLCYLPTVISDDLVIVQDAILEHDVEIEEEIYVTVYPGIELRSRGNFLIKNGGLLDFQG